MQRLPNMTDEELKQQSSVYINQSVVTTYVIAMGIVAGCVMFIIGMSLSWLSLVIKLLLSVFFLGFMGFFMMSLFKGSWFFLAANKEGWFYRSIEPEDSYVFVPWAECVDVRTALAFEGAVHLHLRVKNTQLQNIPSPQNGSITVKAEYIDFHMGGLFNAERVAEKLNRLKRESDRLGHIEVER